MNGPKTNEIGFWSPVGASHAMRSYAYAASQKKRRKPQHSKLTSFKQNPKVYRRKDNAKLFSEDARPQAAPQKKEDSLQLSSDQKIEAKSTSSGCTSSYEEPAVTRHFFSKARACIAPPAQALPVFHF